MSPLQIKILLLHTGMFNPPLQINCVLMICFSPPHTPERDRTLERDRLRHERELQMTSPSRRHRRHPPQTREPSPTPVRGTPPPLLYPYPMGFHGPHIPPPSLIPLIPHTPHQRATLRYGPPLPHPPFMTPAQIQTRNSTHLRDQQFQQLSPLQQRNTMLARAAQAAQRREQERSERNSARAEEFRASQARRDAEQAARRQNQRQAQEQRRQRVHLRRQQEEDERRQHELQAQERQRQEEEELRLHELQAQESAQERQRQHQEELRLHELQAQERQWQEQEELREHQLLAQEGQWQQQEELREHELQAQERQRQQQEEHREHELQAQERQRQQQQRRHRPQHNLEKHYLLGRKPYQEPESRFNLGLMDVICPKCQALHWNAEKLLKSTRTVPSFGTCCLQGQISLPPFSPPPEPLRRLLIGKGLPTDPPGVASQTSKHFRDNIRQYNSAFAFTSLQANLDEKITNAPGPFAFRIFGSLHHRLAPIGPIHPNGPQNFHKYAQLYVYDAQEALRVREQRNPNLKPSVMQAVQDMLYRENPFIQTFKQAAEVLYEKVATESTDVEVQLHMSDDADRRRYNLPTADEVAAVIPGDGTDRRVVPDRDILLRYREGGIRRISHLHPNYTPLHYVLMFPKGDKGWDKGTPLVSDAQGRRRTKSGLLSETLYYAYRLHHRANEAISSVFLAGKLFHQYIVDAWASTEQSKLSWIHNNQKEIRAELYQGLKDTIHNDDHSGDLNDTGRRVILPSTHTGSPRHMYQLFQDSMAICRYYQKPDIFLTMTANPQWPEIRAAMPKDDEGNPIGEPSDYPDIIAQVFEMKKNALLKEVKSGIFGKCVAHVHTIEFQKRGLPHMHLLIFLAPEDRIRTPADVDHVSCAQIPDPITQPLLYETVTKSMLHGPCNEKCQDDQGRCSKRYPKAFSEQTLFSDNGYPELARPNNGRTVTKRIRGQDVTFTNRDVVPYNPYLTAKYDCHINVEICNSVQAIKYIHKYIYKGHDRTTLEFDSQDEVKAYLDARYVSAIEACWRLFEFNMHAEEPTVYRLPVHLENQQVVYYHPEDEPNEVLAQGERDDRLTGYFRLNATDVGAHNYTYQEIPQHYVWDPKSKKWKPRQRQFAIGRMYFAAPSAGERFYLRLLLTVVKGATSFQDLRTVGKGTPTARVCNTYKEACLALGLLEDDQEWRECLQEASVMHLGRQMRDLFVTLLLHCHPAQPLLLWEEFKDNLCDDLGHALNIRSNFPLPVTADLIYDYGLYLISESLRESGKDLSDYNLPEVANPNLWNAIFNDNYLLAEQLDYDHDALRAVVETNKQLMNEEQHAIFDAVLASSIHQEGKVFYLQSAGGCGKTWISNTIASAVRAEERLFSLSHLLELQPSSFKEDSLLIHGSKFPFLFWKTPCVQSLKAASSTKLFNTLASLYGMSSPCSIGLPLKHWRGHYGTL